MWPEWQFIETRHGNEQATDNKKSDFVASYLPTYQPTYLPTDLK